MSRMMKKVVNYLVYILCGNAICGLLLYFLVTSLAKISLLLAYVGNIAFILFVLAFDEIVLRNLRPEKVYQELKKAGNPKDREASLRFYRWTLEYYMSFKSFLLVFYIAVLIFSQILKFYPHLAGEDLTAFVNTIDYSVLILVAFNDFKERFSSDKNRSKAKLEAFEVYLQEHPFE